MVEIKFNVWSVLLIVLISVSFVYSYGVGGKGSGNPAVMGHSADEIEVTDEFCRKITGEDCGVSAPTTPTCTSHDAFTCSTDLYWYDSCGKFEEIESCNGYGCSSAGCNVAPPTTTCTSYSSYKCYNNDIYYYDSCGVREAKKTECGTLGCDTGSSSCNVETCTSHDSYKCYGEDVYWYDSCGVRETKKEDCGSFDCSSGGCDYYAEYEGETLNCNLANTGATWYKQRGRCGEPSGITYWTSEALRIGTTAAWNNFNEVYDNICSGLGTSNDDICNDRLLCNSGDDYDRKTMICTNN